MREVVRESGVVGEVGFGGLLLRWLSFMIVVTVLELVFLSVCLGMLQQRQAI